MHRVHRLCCQVCLTCLQCNHCWTSAINSYTIEKYCIHLLQAGNISGFPNVAYIRGYAARAAGGESILYFTKTWDFLELWRERRNRGERNHVNWIVSDSHSLLLQFFPSLTHCLYPLIFHLMFILEFPFLKILCNLGGGVYLDLFLITKPPAHQWIGLRIQTCAS